MLRCASARWLWPAGIALAACVPFLPSLQGQFLYWDDVARPGDIIDTGVNPTQLPNANGAGQLFGPARLGITIQPACQRVAGQRQSARLAVTPTAAGRVFQPQHPADAGGAAQRGGQGEGMRRAFDDHGAQGPAGRAQQRGVFLPGPGMRGEFSSGSKAKQSLAVRQAGQAAP